MATQHFTDEEFCTSGNHPEIANVPNEIQRANMQKTQEKLEEARAIVSAYYRKETPVTITYGGRCTELNTACKGSTTSAHLEWLAADTKWGHDPASIAAILMRHPTFMMGIDQMIIERGCLHLGLPCKASNYIARHELRHDRINGCKRDYPLMTIWRPE